jgi:hypothetical protein
MIDAVLADLRVKTDHYRVVPFPIETPDALTASIPARVLALTTIYDDWNRRKIEILRAVGYEVEVLWDRPPGSKEHAAGEVRRLMSEGDEMWRVLVPAAVSGLIDSRGLPSSLRASQDG